MMSVIQKLIGQLAILFSYLALCQVTRFSLSSDEGSVNWICLDDVKQCRRVIGPESNNNLTLQACRLTCGSGNTLWPFPTGSFEISTNLIAVDISTRHFNFQLSEPSTQNADVRESCQIVQDQLLSYLTRRADDGYDPQATGLINIAPLNVTATIIPGNDRDAYSYNEPEGYFLRKTGANQSIEIVAENIKGFHNAWTTLVQLIIYDSIKRGFYMPESFDIMDGPAFPHRGVMLDTAHNFLDVTAIYRLMSALAFSKINTVHLHLTDSTSFPLMTIRHPEFAYYGAYGPSNIYTYNDMMAIVSAAKLFGIRIIPELPVPGPMGAGWYRNASDGFDDLVVCHSSMPYNTKCSNPPCGQLNIVNDKAVQLLKDLYDELVGIFGKTVYHVGGSDVDTSCWPTLTASEAHRRWANLLNELADMIISRGGEVIVNSNALLRDREEWLSPSKFIIQVTEPSSDVAWVQELLARGYRLILSPEDLVRWDCGYGPYSPHQNYSLCAQMMGWQKGYSISVHNKVSGSQNILGAEGQLYSFQSHSYNTEERVLLRAAGLAERFWTNPATDYLAAYPRLGYHSWLLRSFGFHLEGFEPYWCTQNTGKCLLGE